MSNPKDTQPPTDIEVTLCKLLQEILENCLIEFPGLTKYSFHQYGEVYNLQNGGRVQVLPGYHEAITVAKGPTVCTLNRSYEEPKWQHLPWKLSVRRSFDGKPVKFVASHDLSEDTRMLPITLDKVVCKKLQEICNKLIRAYTDTRTKWRQGVDPNVVEKLAANDLLDGFSEPEVEEINKNKHRGAPSINPELDL